MVRYHRLYSPHAAVLPVQAMLVVCPCLYVHQFDALLPVEATSVSV